MTPEGEAAANLDDFSTPEEVSAGAGWWTEHWERFDFDTEFINPLQWVYEEYIATDRMKECILIALG